MRVMTTGTPHDADEPTTLPAFPQLGMGESRVRLKKEWSARAWTGKPDRLVQIQDEIQKALRTVYDETVRSLPLTPDGHERAVALGEALRLSVRAAGNENRLTRSGELAAIFAETDLGDIDTLSMSNRDGAKGHVSLVFRRQSKEGSTTVNLQVSGSDRSWVGGTAELLQTEIAKGVPGWAWLRHGFVSVLLGAMLGWGLAGLLLATVANDPRDSLFAAAVMGLLFGGTFGGIIIWSLMQRLFPGFEILEPGSSSTGRRVLGGVVTILGLALGIAGVALGVLAL